MAHTTMRWVHQLGPELDKRIRLFLRNITTTTEISEQYN